MFLLFSTAIFEEFNNTEMKYKNRVRSRVANLKDVRNPQLRQNVLIGLISAKKIASMSAEVNVDFFKYMILKKIVFIDIYGINAMIQA